jgi:hypothetical protein
MFVCALCGTCAPRNVSPVVVVVETRTRSYAVREHAHRKPGSRRRVRKTWAADRGGLGHEPARSVIACAGCAHREQR